MRASLAAWEAVAFVQVAFQSCAYSRDDAKRRLRVWRRRWMRELVLDQQVKSNGALGQSSEAASALEQNLAGRDDHSPICTLYFRRWFLYVALKNRSLFFSDAPWQGYFGPGTHQTVEIGT